MLELASGHVDSYGLVQQVHDATRDAGGTLDVVCSRGDLLSLSVDVNEIRLSDHRLLCWTAPFTDPVYLTGSVNGPVHLLSITSLMSRGAHLAWMPFCVPCRRLHCAMNSSSSSWMVMRSSSCTTTR